LLLKKPYFVKGQSCRSWWWSWFSPPLRIWCESTPPISPGLCIRWGNLTYTTSAIFLPWPGGCRSETLLPLLSVEFAFVGGVELSDYRIGTCNENFKNRWGGGGKWGGREFCPASPAGIHEYFS